MRFPGKGTLKGDPAISAAELGEKQKLFQERNRSYFIILGLFIVIGLLSVALVCAFPLKEVEAVIVTVDGSTGHVIKTQVAHPEVLAQKQSVMENEAYEYVLCRNTADNDDRQRCEDYIASHSTESVDNQFRGEISINNDDSPYRRTGANGRQKVKINSVSLTDKNKAQVLFETAIWKEGKRTELKYWVANIQFVFSGKSKLGRDKRWINPLGYIVTNYSQDEQLSKPVTAPKVALSSDN